MADFSTPECLAVLLAEAKRTGDEGALLRSGEAHDIQHFPKHAVGVEVLFSQLARGSAMRLVVLAYSIDSIDSAFDAREC